MEKEKIVLETTQRLKESGVNTASQLEIVYALAQEIEQLNATVQAYQDAGSCTTNAENAQPTSEVFYLCDRRACEECRNDCAHIKDIRHAQNFVLIGKTFVEHGTKYYGSPTGQASCAD